MDRFPIIYSTYNRKCSEGNYSEALEYLKDEWHALSEPKYSQSESFYIVVFITELYLILKDIDNAKEWSRRIFKCDLDRADTGEREFLVGKVAYEERKYELAKEHFDLANKKSEGRIFTKRDGKYLKFFKKGIIE